MQPTVEQLVTKMANGRSNARNDWSDELAENNIDGESFIENDMQSIQSAFPGGDGVGKDASNTNTKLK